MEEVGIGAEGKMGGVLGEAIREGEVDRERGVKGEVGGFCGLVEFEGGELEVLEGGGGG